MTEDLLAAALRLHQVGRAAEAEKLYLRVLRADPANVDALHLLGVLQAQAGRHAEAAERIAKAVALSPDFALAQFNLGNALRALKRDGEAASAYMKAASLSPGHAPTYLNLAGLLRTLGRPLEAVSAYRRAVGLKPADPEAHLGLGMAFADLDRHAEAVAAYRRAIEHRAGYADALVNLGASLQALGRDGEALSIYRQAVAAQPHHFEARVDLGAAYHALGQFSEAEGAFRAALALRPDDAATHVRLGASLQGLGRHEAAIAAHRRALSIEPNLPEAYVSLAVALQEIGMAAEAMEAAERALALDPGSTEAWFVRSDLKTFAPGDADIDAMERLLASIDMARMSAPSRPNLDFALGKAWMDVGEPDRAFRHLDAANRLVRRSLDYDLDRDLARLAATAEAFPPERMSNLAASGFASDLPIFVVGMPRSGTSLVEQVLASHPDIHGAGELTALGEVIASVFSSAFPMPASLLTPERLAEAGRAYVDRTTPLAQGKARLVDKMPANFQFAGLIHLMLPGARIVHCRRDPIDTCLSCYSKKFAGRQDYAYDLGELGRYYRGYEALMAHWRAVLPANRFVEVRYEDLVGDLEAESRRLIDFCGLDWNDACLAFHRTERPVRTASVNQVRRPIYRTSVARWKPYAAHLPPLFEALGLDPSAV